MSALELPNLALVVLFGPTGAGTTTFVRQHFHADEILSPEQREQIAERLEAGQLVVVEPGPLRQPERRELADLAEALNCQAIAVVLDLPEEVCRQRLRAAARDPKPVRQQSHALKQCLHKLPGDGYAAVHVLTTPEEVAALTVLRRPLAVDRRDDHGPFDILGDVHGCTDELEALLGRLGYVARGEAEGCFTYPAVYTHPEGRRAVFLGDLVDRGPRSLDALQLVQHMVTAGSALAVPGNHDTKLVRTLRGRPTEVHGGLARTLAEFDAVPEEVRISLTALLCDFIDGLPSHLVLAGGNLVVAHAGLRHDLQGRDSKQVTSFCLHGDVARIDASGTPWMRDWVSDYQGRAMVVYGHAPVQRALWINNTLDIDTGCAFGGALTAWRYPENELVAVPARRVYKAARTPIV